MFRVFTFLLGVIAGLVHAEPVDTVTPSSLQYYTESYAPANYLENGIPTGASVETLKLIWQHMGIPEQPIKVLPWARGYHFTLNQPKTMLFSMIKTPEREHLFKWVGPIFTNSLTFVATSDSHDEINQIEDTFNKTVVVVRDDVAEVELIKTGFPRNNIIGVTKLDQALMMVKSKRADLMLVTYESMPALVVKNDMHESEFKRLWTLSVNGNYYAFNRETPDSLVAQFQSALDNVREQHLNILRQYDLQLELTNH